MNEKGRERNLHEDDGEGDPFNTLWIILILGVLCLAQYCGILHP